MSSGGDGDGLICFEGVTKVYGEGTGRVFALRGIDVRISAGEMVALMGPSGSGKSTTLQIMGCLDVATGGSYFFRGLDTKTLPRDDLSLLRRNYLGFIFQGFHLLARTSAVENVELPLLYQGLSSSKRRAKAKAAIAAVGLTGVEDHLPNELSGGEQQRVAIARALVTDPSVVLADEPTGNLDSARAIEIMEILTSLNQQRGITIVMVTHEPDMAAYARRIIRFKDGLVVSDERDLPTTPVRAPRAIELQP